MFGLERENTEDVDFSYDLENDMQDPKKHEKMIKEIYERLQTIKTILRKGTDKKLYDQYGTLLHGYSALMTVMNNSIAKKS